MNFSTHAGRVEWLKYRFNLVLLTPFQQLVAFDNNDCYVWLCVTNLLCGAVEALASFEFATNNPMTVLLKVCREIFQPGLEATTKFARLETAQTGQRLGGSSVQVFSMWIRTQFGDRVGRLASSR